jgi:hypothetical protein
MQVVGELEPLSAVTVEEFRKELLVNRNSSGLQSCELLLIVVD